MHSLMLTLYIQQNILLPTKNGSYRIRSDVCKLYLLEIRAAGTFDTPLFENIGIRLTIYSVITENTVFC